MFRIVYSALLFSCFVGLPVYADGQIKGRAESNLRMGHERSILMTEFWVPFAQSKSLNTVLYGSLRMMGDNENNREGNLGVGYRQVLDVKGVKGVAGVHGWFDRRITDRGSKFNQITTGVEWLGEAMDVRLNGYLPLSDEREIDVSNANPQSPGLAGTGIVVDTGGRILEEPLHGFDLELGLELGRYVDFARDHTDSFRIYGGGYYFNGDNAEDVAGVRARTSVDVTENIQLGARFQRDDVRGSQGFLEATLRFPFGQKKSYRKDGLRARLDESPERDIDIVTGSLVTDAGDRIQVLNQVTGMAQEVLHVNNMAASGGDGSAENPFNTLSAAESAASAETIIYVNYGDGTSTNQDQGITLNSSGQQLIGSGTNFVYDSGQFTTANGADPIGTIIAAATTSPVIGNVNANQDAVTIAADDITVAGLTIDNANTGRDGVVIIADGAAASAQNIIVQNVVAQNNRHGIYIHGADDGAVSAMVQNTVTTSNTQHGIAVYDDTSYTFDVDLGGGSMGSVGNNVLAGNTLEDLAVEYDGRALSAQNNWWGQASGPDTDTPDIGIRPQIYYGAPINDGLVGHWTFDTEWTTNTTAYDRSGQGNDGTLQGGLSLTDQVAGPNRQALDFDGINDFVSVANDPSLNFGTSDFSLISKILPVRNGWNGIVGKGGSGVVGYGMEISSSGDLSASIQVNANQHVTTSIALFSSQTVASVFDRDANISQYINDSLVNSSGYSSNNGVGSVDNSNNLAIGAYHSGALWRFQSHIDDTRIYNRALSSSEVSEIHRMDTSSSVDASGFLPSSP